MTERVAVLGGGAAGVVAASYLSRDPRFTVELLECSDRLGGLHRGTHIDGIALDIGAFLFSSEHEMLAAFPAVRDRFVRVSPQYVRVTPQGSFDRYPLSLAGFRRDHGLGTTCLALADLAVSKVRDRARASVREFASYYMGRSIYQKSGLPQYLRRLYGMDDTEIALDFALQRLTSLRDYTFTNAVKRLLQRFHAFARRLPPFKLLARPLGGFEQVYDEIADELRANGVNIETSLRLTRIERDDGFVVHSDRGARRYEHLISTIPMPSTLSLLGIEPQGTYDAMDLYSLYFRGRVIPGGDVYYNFTNDGLW
ncbi:MAG TPA: FAD-dependent oxidoreductase, partial [Thermoanaerobaculia bacterium]|nr:FAD-dependent oxidoreductase [Thermoanaerobaculia bacterium]